MIFALGASERISRLLLHLWDFSRKEPYELQRLDMREILDGVARLAEYDPKWRAELTRDRIALARADYEREGPGRTNLRYGFVVKPVG